MKNRIAVSLGVLLLLAAHASADEPRHYVRTIPLERVFMHSAGYKVVYRTSRLEIAETYIPAAWFGQRPDARGQLLFTNRRAAPYLQMYYLDGEFSYVRLVVRGTAHPTWGLLPNRPEELQRFNAVGDQLRIRY